jgi:hypothetical protein
LDDFNFILLPLTVPGKLTEEQRTAAPVSRKLGTLHWQAIWEYR